MLLFLSIQKPARFISYLSEPPFKHREMSRSSQTRSRRRMRIQHTFSYSAPYVRISKAEVRYRVAALCDRSRYSQTRSRRRMRIQHMHSYIQLFCTTCKNIKGRGSIPGGGPMMIGTIFFVFSFPLWKAPPPRWGGG